MIGLTNLPNYERTSPHVLICFQWPCYLNKVHSDGPKYIHNAYYTTVQPHSYYITNIFETKEQVPWVEILADLEDTPWYLVKLLSWKNENSEFVFILNRIKWEHKKHFLFFIQKLDPTQRSISQFNILSKKTRPLAFEKKICIQEWGQVFLWM